MWKPKCPRCRSEEVEEHEVAVSCFDRYDDFTSTHQCKKCFARFKITPPDRGNDGHSM